MINFFFGFGFGVWAANFVMARLYYVDVTKHDDHKAYLNAQIDHLEIELQKAQAGLR